MKVHKRTSIGRALKTIFSKHTEILFAYLYGSYAKGEEGPLSDIDIAVFFDKTLSPAKRAKVKGTVENDIIDAFPDTKIDLIDLNDFESLTPLLKREIVYDGILVYSKDEAARARFESIAIGEWLDWQPYADFYTATAFQEVQEFFYGK